MSDFLIRPFRYSDLDALIEIARVSFAEDFMASGLTPEGLVQQVRTYTRGRMVPFRILAFVSRLKWGMFVAEVNGRVVGFASYQGQNQVTLNNLMVDPAYRRRGIGQALLQARLQAIARQGLPYVTTRVLAHNEASLGNLRKQGFTIFERFTLFEAPLPLPVQGKTDLVARSLEETDQARFQELERHVRHPAWLKIMGSSWRTYWPPPMVRLQFRLTRVATWVRAFEQAGETIGFLGAESEPTRAKGILYRPVIALDHLDRLPTLIGEAAAWLTLQGKQTVRMAVADEFQNQWGWMADAGWEEKESWVQLVKWLESPVES